MDSFSFYSVRWITSKELGPKSVPIMFFDGEAAIGVNQWLIGLVKSGISASSLDNHMRAIGHLYNFNKVLGLVEGDDYNPNHLLAKFIDAKLYGTDKHCTSTNHPYLKSLFLDWLPVNRESIKRSYLSPINDFDKWQSTFHGAERLNPSEQVFLTQYQKYLDFKQRSSWDMLLHLSPSRSATHEVHAVGINDRSHKRLTKTQNKLRKSFPSEKFIELIDALKNPRDKLLFLFYGAGSLRRSEPPHLFLSDVKGIDKLGQLIIRLEDPVRGRVDWEDSRGVTRTTSRLKYFQENFQNDHLPERHPLKNLMPRDQYLNCNDSLHAGFKGMEFLDGGLTASGEAAYQELFWCTPELGRYAAKVFFEYAEQYIYRNPFERRPNPLGWPYHPWLFISLTKAEYGMPMTLTGIKACWNRALKRMEMEGCGYGIHSLRHLFAFYCANVLRLPVEILQGMLHHGDIASTQVYYNLSNTTVRQALLDANGATKDGSLLTLSSDFKYQYPVEWSIQ